MANDIVKVSFNGSCAPITYPCAVNDKYINPCSCTDSFLCEHIGSIIPQQCPGGTGFNYKTNLCLRLEDLVFQGLCDQLKPWKRCKDAESNAYDDDDINEYELEQRCTGSATRTTTPTPPPQGDGDGGVDGGLIAGIIIAVLLVIIIAVLLIVYVRKKGNPIRSRNLKETRVWRNLTHKEGGDQSNRQSTASPYGHGDEETYAEINDSAIYKDPTSREKSLGPSLSHSNETYDRDDVEQVTYDNPALKRDTPSPPNIHVSSPLPEYSALEEGGHISRSYSSLNEHNAAVKHGVNSNQPTTGDDGYLVAEAIGQSLRSESPADPYFMLEKEEPYSEGPVNPNSFTLEKEES